MRQKLTITGIAIAFVCALPAQAMQQAEVGQFADGLAEASKNALNERTSRFSELEQKIRAPQTILLACQFVGRSGERQFQIQIYKIAEPKEDMGTSLIWRASASFRGELPPGLTANEEVSYGGPPDDIGIYFQSSQLRLERVTWGWAAQHKSGLIKCTVRSGSEFVY